MPRVTPQTRRRLDARREIVGFRCGDPLCPKLFRSRSALSTHCMRIGHEHPIGNIIYKKHQAIAQDLAAWNGEDREVDGEHQTIPVEQLD